MVRRTWGRSLPLLVSHGRGLDVKRLKSNPLPWSNKVLHSFSGCDEYHSQWIGLHRQSSISTVSQNRSRVTKARSKVQQLRGRRVLVIFRFWRPAFLYKSKEDVNLVNCANFVCTRVPGDSYRRRFRSLVYLVNHTCDVDRALMIKSLTWFCRQRYFQQ